MELKSRVRASILAYSSVFFIEDLRHGLVLLILTFYNINVGIAGLWGVLSLHLFDHFLGKNDEINSEAFLVYNSLLISLGVGYVFSLNIYVLTIISFLSISTYLLSILIKNIFLKYKLPVLSVPFCMMMMLFFMAKENYTNLFSITYPKLLFPWVNLNLPLAVSLFFKSIGAVIFTPYEFSGIAIFILFILKSRNMAMIMVISYTFGYAMEFILATPNWQNTALIYSYNHILVAIGLCSVYMLPSLKSLLIMPFAVFSTVMINDALLIYFGKSNLPVFTVSFNLTTLLFLYSLSVLKYKNFPTTLGGSPENTFDWTSLDLLNNYNSISIASPFHGEFDIYQSFDDEWTHTGKWKHALDFVIRDDKGSTYSSENLIKEDYYCFSANVYSPANGIISGLVMGLEDNEIGSVDTDNNWGNYLMIYSDDGFYILLSHLKKLSSLLKVGDRVFVGQLIALCGNSGYSPEPHLHIQVQETPFLGDKTIPFVIEEFIEDKIFVSNKVPKRNARIRYNNVKRFSYALSIYIGKKLNYRVRRNYEKIDRNLSIEIKLDKERGHFYWEDKLGNRLYITKRKSCVTFDYFEGNVSSDLALLYSCLPELPYYYEPGLKWFPYLSFKVASRPLKSYLTFLFSFFIYDLKHQNAILNFNFDHNTICFKSLFQGKEIAGEVLLDDVGDIKKICSKSFTFEKDSI